MDSILQLFCLQCLTSALLDKRNGPPGRYRLFENFDLHLLRFVFHQTSPVLVSRCRQRFFGNRYDLRGMRLANYVFVADGISQYCDYTNGSIETGDQFRLLFRLLDIFSVRSSDMRRWDVPEISASCECGAADHDVEGKWG